jgi:DNA-directed RNA polymerase specialized sigma24 family protein
MEEDFKQLKTLTEVVKDAISLKESESSRKLMYFIKRSLGQLGLAGQYEESEVLIKAYLRVRDKILSGTRIENYLGYLTQVSYYIILEESRQRRRQIRLGQKLSYITFTQEIMPDGSFYEGVSEELIGSLWVSFSTLSERDKEILILRIVRGLSWKEIGFLMVSQGKERRFHASLEAKLRKQGERALTKLRKQLSSVNYS